MDFNEYVIRTQETVIYAPEVALHYLIPGLLVEALELLYADVEDEIKEAGDVCWFIARLLEELKADSFLPIGCPLSCAAKHEILHHSRKLCDMWVKAVRDNGAINLDEFQSRLDKIRVYLIVLADQHNLTLSDIMQANVDKLADRKARGVLSGSGGDR